MYVIGPVVSFWGSAAIFQRSLIKCRVTLGFCMLNLEESTELEGKIVKEVSKNDKRIDTNKNRGLEGHKVRLWVGKRG